MTAGERVNKLRRRMPSKAQSKAAMAIKIGPEARKDLSINLLSSGLYRWLPKLSESCPSTSLRTRRLYYQWGVTPRPEGISYSLPCFLSLSMMGNDYSSKPEEFCWGLSES